MSELKADPDPNKLLDSKLETDFLQNPPTVDDGLAISNSEAGISIRLKEFKVAKNKTEGTNILKKTYLMEQLINVRGRTKEISGQKKKFMAEIKIK